jgi:hypothetical protein
VLFVDSIFILIPRLPSGHGLRDFSLKEKTFSSAGSLLGLGLAESWADFTFRLPWSSDFLFQATDLYR